MSYVMTAVSVGVSMASTAFASIQQNKAMDAQIEQAEIDQTIATNETKMAMEEENRASALEQSNKRREAMRVKADVLAQQAGTGVAGVTSARQQRNVDFQNQFDMNTIQANNRSKLINISQVGASNAQQINSTINNARANKTSNAGIIAKTTLAGLGTYAQVKPK